MRTSRLLVLALLPLSACDWGFVSPFSDWGTEADWWGDSGWSNYEPYIRSGEGMTQMSSLWSPANGVAFTERGEIGVAGLGTMTCRFRTASGQIDVDVDLDQSGEETVDDSCGECDDGLVIAAIGPSRVVVSSFDDYGSNTSDTFELPGTIGVRFDGRDLVYGQQDDGCRVGWTDSDLSVRVGTLCSGFDATANGTAVIATDGTVKVVTSDGAIDDLGQPAQLVAYDAVHDQIYTAIAGDDTVRAVSMSGTVRWTVTLEGRITTLTDLADRGGALVGLSVGSAGSLIVLDGATGAQSAWAETNEAATALWVSPDGNTVGARTSWNTHFLALDQ